MMGTAGSEKSVSSSTDRMTPPARPRSGFGMSMQKAGSKPRSMTPVSRPTASSGWPGKP